MKWFEEEEGLEKQGN